MIEQILNYTDSTVLKMIDFFETRVENLNPKEDSASSKKKIKERKSNWRIWDVSESNVVDSSEESSVDYQSVGRKYYVLHGKCNQITNNSKDLKSMDRKPKKKKKNFQTYTKGQYIYARSQSRTSC